MTKGLLIEDDQDIANLIVEDFADANLMVEHVADGAVGLERALSGDFDFILLDWMLPSLEGSEVCRGIRQSDERTPIIMLTSKNRALDKVLLLELGADDYVTKPFDLDVLRARVKAILRRSKRQEGVVSQEDVIVRDELEIDLIKRRVTKAGELIELTAREFDIVALLAKNPGRPFTREQISEAIDGMVVAGNERALTSAMNRIRNRLEPDPKNPTYVKTARGVGYYFSEE